ncbi:prolyl-tRNA synthetase [Anopheles sinensis]|uniref:Prolyl-tRNA synthetase n=1 Tax=Anopheles sinensis TaxID=74873 RepID=A0A084WA79_ANOSI|nr:prolyl-tRNA synthetase [Anopheles sinensis]
MAAGVDAISSRLTSGNRSARYNLFPKPRENPAVPHCVEEGGKPNKRSIGTAMDGLNFSSLTIKSSSSSLFHVGLLNSGERYPFKDHERHKPEHDDGRNKMETEKWPHSSAKLRRLGRSLVYDAI